MYIVTLVKANEVVYQTLYNDKQMLKVNVDELIEELELEYQHIEDDTWLDVQSGEEINLFVLKRDIEED